MRRALLIGLVAIACRSRSDEHASPTPTATPSVPSTPIVASTPIDPPAAAGALAPQLRADADGVLATWLEPAGDGAHRLVWAQWTRGAWTKPQQISAGTAIVASAADVPSIARSNDGALVAHWAEKREGDRDGYSAVVARSTDGATWTRLGALHDDHTPTEHGFVSLIAEGDASIRAFWLDGRMTASGGATALRSAAVGKTIGASAVVDDRVCDCCSTAITHTLGGALIAYRDRSADEIRDVAIAQASGQGWRRTIVARDNWKIEGCPVNGPAVTYDGYRLAVAWYTMADNVPRVRVAFSNNGGLTFGAPIDVASGQGDGAPLGRVGVVVDGSTVIISWLAARSGGASVLLRRVAANGQQGRAITAGETADRDAGFPRIAQDGNAVIVMWTDPGAPKRLRAITLPAGKIP